MKKTNIVVLLVFGLCCIMACHHHHDHEHEHHHEHEHEGVGQWITVYGGDYEIYAETTPVIMGEKMTVVSHITQIKDYKPVEDSAVEMMVAWQGKDYQKVEVLIEDAGKYKATLTPETSGVARLKWIMKDGTELKMDSLKVYANREKWEAIDHTKPAPPNSVTFTKEQGWACDFGTELVEPAVFGNVIKTAAEVVSAQGDERVVTAKASGIINYSSSGIVEGSVVKKGQRLFVIESSGMADGNMNVRYQEALASYSAAKAEYERKQTLAKEKIVSQSDLERSKATYEASKATYDNLKGNFSPKGAEVKSPESGYVKRITVRNGEFVEAGQAVVVITQNKDLYLRAEVSPRYYTYLKDASDANIETGNGMVYNVGELGGSIVGYGKSTGDGNGLIPITYRIENRVDLMAGNFVTLYVVCKSTEQVITIANEGIVEEMGNNFVFVQVTPELFEKRLVTIGGSDGKRTVIESGVKEGERVVSKGAIMVKLAQGAGALDPHAGHVH